MDSATIRPVATVGLVLALLLAAGWQAVAATGSGSYVDPHGRFTMMVPPGAQVVDTEGKIAVGIQSRKGYAISIQTGRADPKLGLDQLVARFESTNVGPTKRWPLKVSQQAINVGRLPAYDAVYEGNRSRVRMVVARGRNTNFVFIFQSSPAHFAKLVREFEWLLANFRPAPVELGEQPKRQDGTVQAGMESLVKQPAPPPPPMAPRRFADPEYGFSMEYPVDWVSIKASATAVWFGGREGTEAYNATVSVQNVQPAKAKDPADAAERVLEDLRKQLETGAYDVQYLGEGPFSYMRGGFALDGHQFLVVYAVGNNRFKQWTVVLPRPRGTVAHVWTYRTPEPLFNLFRPTAETMLKGWRIEATVN